MPDPREGVLNQKDIQILGDPAAGDRAGFSVLPGFGGVPLLEAEFHHFTFTPHTHDCLMIGVILGGEKRFSRGRRAHAARGPMLTVVNAGEVHTGGTVGDGTRLHYLGLYPTPALMAAAGLGPAGDYPEAVIEDPALWQAFVAALRAPDVLSAEARVVTALSALAARHSAAPQAALPRADGRAVAVARDYIEAQLDSPLRLEEIAAVAGVTPRHLIRSFGAVLGLSP
ncbi:AraC family transcriptional regulator, partial [Thioclava sp. BHET1]